MSSHGRSGRRVGEAEASRVSFCPWLYVKVLSSRVRSYCRKGSSLYGEGEVVIVHDASQSSRTIHFVGDAQKNFTGGCCGGRYTCER